MSCICYEIRISAIFDTAFDLLIFLDITLKICNAFIVCDDNSTTLQRQYHVDK